MSLLRIGCKDTNFPETETKKVENRTKSDLLARKSLSIIGKGHVLVHVVGPELQLLRLSDVEV